MNVSIRRSIDTLPAHARVWIYKSMTPFTTEQREVILARGQEFTSTWAAHGATLDACVDVLHDRFIVIGVDEQQALASGCSIDKSVRFIQELERDLDLSLTDRMVVWYVDEGIWRACRVPEVPSLLSTGKITAETIMFDDLVTTKGDLDEHFRAPLRETWLARYL